jgi:DNA-binding CsgD family transcriptional regulator
MTSRTPSSHRPSGTRPPAIPLDHEPANPVETAERLMASLPAPSLRALQVAAVIGNTFSLSDVAAVLGLPVGRVLAQLQAVLDAGVLIGGTMAFADPAVRDAIYMLVPPPIRLALHRQVGQVLAERGGSSAAATGHLVRGAQLGDREALRSLDTAIGELMAANPSAAVELAIRALDLSEISDADRLGRGLSATRALWSSGRVSEAIDLAESLLRGPGRDAGSRAGLGLIIGIAAFLDARPDDAIASVAPILAMPELDDETYAEAQQVHLLADIVGERLPAARLRAETVLAGGDRTGGDAALPGALAGLAYVDWAEGRASSATGLLRAAIQRSERGPAGRSLIAQLGLITILPSMGEHEEAKAVADEARRTVEAGHQKPWIAGLAALTARMHALHNDMPEAKGEARTALAAGVEQELSLFNATARFALACVLIAEGDLVGAQREIAAIRAEPAAGRAVLGRPSHLYLEARLREAQSGTAEALDLLAPILADPAMHRRLFADMHGSGPWLVRAALAADRRDWATAVAGASHWLAIANPGTAVYAAESGLAQGLLNGDADRLVSAAERLPLAWSRASAEEDAGRVLLEDDPARAVQHFERALDGYEQSGSERDASRVRSRLRRRGLKVRAGHDRREAASGWGALTDAQLRIAMAVGSGLTNAAAAERLSLSYHTVGSHLRTIYEKLDIHSRVMLVQLVVERSNSASGGDTSPHDAIRVTTPPRPMTQPGSFASRSRACASRTSRP